jgi:linoleoyl-CoA desaturase
LSFLVLHYVVLGLSGVLLAFNVAHDATHGSFSKNRIINKLIYYSSFNLNGTNAYLWGIRHKSSHHIFPNVDGCDADIDDNPLIRLSSTKAWRPHHQYQAWYAPLIYLVYTLHWVLFKDFLYLTKKKLANLQSIKHSFRQVGDVFFWKALYVTMYIILPVMYGYSLKWVLLSFLFLHIAISLLFILSLIVSHLTLETDFPVPDAKNKLPYNYYRHQLATSLDYAPASHTVNFIFGGFNSHAAHHLFPAYPHTVYADIAPIIRELAAKHGYKYNCLPWYKAIASHFRYLHKLGNGYRAKREKVYRRLALGH